MSFMLSARKKFTIGTEFEGARLDRFVRALMPGAGFHAVQAVIRKKKVLVNGKRSSGGALLARGDSVEIAPELLLELSPVDRPAGGGDRPGGRGRPATRGTSAAAGTGGPPLSLIDAFGRIGGGIDVLFEDDRILVIDKPSGLVVQPGNDRHRGSLLDLLEEYRLRGAGTKAGPRSAIGPGSSGGLPPFRYTPVHRLDRGTSGALVVAKDRDAARRLSSAFRSGGVEKVYLAVVTGTVRNTSGVIDTPIRTEKKSRSVSSTGREGRRALTRYRVLERTAGGRTLVEASIGTGRTHQIRVHFASIGHPVCGDRQYGSGKGAKGRLMLHSLRLGFEHPAGNARVEIDCEPPEGFIPTEGQ